MKNMHKGYKTGHKGSDKEVMGYSGGSMKKIKRKPTKHMGAMNGSKNGSY